MGVRVRLTQFTIHNYKIIDDIGPIKADPNVTALVGKNESGKTGVLRALWKSRNRANAEFDKLTDYPR
jgi:predicted ATP-dependent endonuclease of OLD family